MDNFARMMQLADEVFAMHDDPTQLQVGPGVLERLYRLHPATRGELLDSDGPIVWVLVIPTTTALMNAFLAGTLTEQELFVSDRSAKYSVVRHFRGCRNQVSRRCEV